MANDIIFKTKAFGGFKKDEVMTYIGNLIFEKEKLEAKCKMLTETNNALEEKLADFEKISTELETAKAEKDALTEKNTEISETLKELSGVKEELNIFTEQNTQYKEKNASLTAQLVQINNELTEIKSKPILTEEAAESLKTENMRLKAEYDKMKAMEQQVGAAMLDARLRSDELIKEAKEKAGVVTKDVYNAIGDTALKIDDLSKGITDIAREFTKAVGEVEMRINVLTGNMSKTAQALISDSLDIQPLTFSTANESAEKQTVAGYTELVNDIEQSISDTVAEAESEIEAVKDGISKSED